jgi:hypothetical protein
MNKTSFSSGATRAESTDSNLRAFDLIGDIHGQAGLLCELLAKLGYRERDGVWRHPSRTAIFVGDLIDRGPSIRETLAIVRGMVTAGAALAVLGNHEFDALRYHLDPVRHSHLRTQLAATLTQFANHDAEWQSCLEWFRTLPFALELGVIRVVHACWNDAAVQGLRVLPKTIDDDALRLLNDPNSKQGRAAELLLNGMRLELPGDLFVMTYRGVPMNWMRAKWWIPTAGQFYDDLAFPELDVVPRKPVVLPKIDSSTPAGLFDGYPASAAPVFFGHYSLPRDATPQPLASNVACLDYSVWKGGPLIAYRWDGERELSADKFITSMAE